MEEVLYKVDNEESNRESKTGYSESAEEGQTRFSNPEHGSKRSDGGRNPFTYGEKNSENCSKYSIHFLNPFLK